MTSSGARNSSATWPATGTPPRGRPNTTTSWLCSRDSWRPSWRPASTRSPKSGVAICMIHLQVASPPTAMRTSDRSRHGICIGLTPPLDAATARSAGVGSVPRRVPADGRTTAMDADRHWQDNGPGSAARSARLRMRRASVTAAVVTNGDLHLRSANASARLAVDRERTESLTMPGSATTSPGARPGPGCPVCPPAEGSTSACRNACHRPADRAHHHRLRCGPGTLTAAGSASPRPSAPLMVRRHRRRPTRRPLSIRRRGPCRSRSVPGPPSRLSKPAPPPSRSSLPDPPSRSSLPEPPSRVSSP